MFQQQQFQPGQPVQGHPAQMQQMEVVQGVPVGMAPDGDYGKMPIAQVPPEVRSDFIKKVYSLLTIQLFVTFGIALYMNTQLDVYWVKTHLGILYLASFGTLFTMLAVTCCCADTMKTFPTNYIFLGVITVGMSVIVGFTTVMYTTESVLLALATTAGVFLVLTMYACVTKTDFTGFGPYLFAGLCCLSMFGFVMMMWSFITGASLVGTTIHKVYAAGGALLFVFYIIYDTQLIVGGEHKKYEFSVDDYIFATINLYLDVINLFLYLLELFGDRR
mmetsp:Transcript_37218/g.84621  ORF Transcript_37218/g.84621 Transcript_37218/m.84621 type:complete len:275 (-) Transcript_37218:74-898(-)